MSKEIETAAIAFAESKTQDIRAKCLIAGGFTAGAEWGRANPPRCETCIDSKMCWILDRVGRVDVANDSGGLDFGCVHHKTRGE